MKQMRLVNRLAMMVLLVVASAGCNSGYESPLTVSSDGFNDADGFNRADSIVSVVGDTRDYQRLLDVVDSLERAGELSLVKTIFYRTITYNLMGQHRTSLRLYSQLAGIDVKELRTQIELESYIYSYNNYVRVLCEMRRYDRALREAQNADRKLKAAGYNDFANHHDIAQIVGECQLYLGQTELAGKSFQKSLHGVHMRLAAHHDPLDYRECQKTMNAIVKCYIQTGRYAEAEPWIDVQDSLFAIADAHPQRDPVFIDEMRADIFYGKALLAQAQGRTDVAERAFSTYLSTDVAKQLGSIINSSEYLMSARRYEEAARNYAQLDRFLQESGYEADLENIGRYVLPKYRANLLAGHRDSAIHVAAQLAEAYDTALVRQRMIDADLLTTFYDTEGKERQIAEQRAELSQQRLWTVVIIAVIFVIFFAVYTIQRRKAYKALNATNRQLVLANEKAEESSRLKTQFIQQISHEVRTPLNVLSGFAQVLTAPDIDISYDELHTISEKIVENSDRITQLIDKMLDLGLVNANAAIECHDEVRVMDVVNSAVDKSGIRKAAHLDLSLEAMPQDESLTFVTNKKSVVKALTLLLDNAVKFTHPLAFKGREHRDEKAHVTLRVNVSQQDVVFVVEDTGVGIPPEQAGNIFTEFVQLDEYADGTGIGLPIARSLARHMGGDVTLDTTYTAGARFVMSLPLTS